MNVDAMLREISAKQLIELKTFKETEPFEGIRADYRTASIVQMIVNTMGRGKDTPPYTLDQCLLKFKEAEIKIEQEPLWKRQQRVLRAWATGGIVEAAK